VKHPITHETKAFVRYEISRCRCCDCPDPIPRTSRDFFLFATSVSRPTPGPISPSYAVGTGVLSLDAKRSERGANHSHPSRADFDSDLSWRGAHTQGQLCAWICHTELPILKFILILLLINHNVHLRLNGDSPPHWVAVNVVAKLTLRVILVQLFHKLEVDPMEAGWLSHYND